MFIPGEKATRNGLSSGDIYYYYYYYHHHHHLLQDVFFMRVFRPRRKVQHALRCRSCVVIASIVFSLLCAFILFPLCFLKCCSRLPSASFIVTTPQHTTLNEMDTHNYSHTSFHSRSLNFITQQNRLSQNYVNTNGLFFSCRQTCTIGDRLTLEQRRVVVNKWFLKFKC